MHVRPALTRDLSDLGTIATTAVFDDELTQFLAPHRHEHPQCLRLGFLRRAKKRFYDGHVVLAGVSDRDDPWWDGEEKVVGYLSAISSTQKIDNKKRPWFPLSWNALELQLLRLEELIEWYTFADRSLSRTAWLQFFNGMAGSPPFEDIKQHWEIDHLSVDPAYQGKGFGTMLVKFVQEFAAEDKLPVVLLASKQGRSLYKKLGFGDVGTVDMGPGQLYEAMAWYPPDTVTADLTAKTIDCPAEQGRVI
jgi:ribosomal protein S18 acetylase RimI-like enzyme